jgi:glucose-1-phosphate thymidylyltransferase
MTQDLKIIIPTAGWATRMRPQTWSKPKPLVSVAGKTVLDHQLDMFRSVPGLFPEGSRSAGAMPPARKVEIVLILGAGLGEAQIPPFMREQYPGLKPHFVLQPVMRGQADALWLARQHLHGPVLICFSDTLIETDFSFLANEESGGAIWVKPVPDPRRFGVVELDSEGWLKHLVEKPGKMENNLAVVGCYYFQKGEELLSAIEEQMHSGVSKKGEYFLSDTINIMLGRGLKMRTQPVGVWLDTGTIEATLETNRYLLDHGHSSKPSLNKQLEVKIVPPVFIHPDAQVRNSVIGPYASIGEGCSITDARIEDSILEAGARVEAAALQGSYIGRQARIKGHSAESPVLKLNIGDDSSIVLK